MSAASRRAAPTGTGARADEPAAAARLRRGVPVGVTVAGARRALARPPRARRLDGRRRRRPRGPRRPRDVARREAEPRVDARPAPARPAPSRAFSCWSRRSSWTLLAGALSRRAPAPGAGRGLEPQLVRAPSRVLLVGRVVEAALSSSFSPFNSATVRSKAASRSAFRVFTGRGVLQRGCSIHCFALYLRFLRSAALASALPGVFVAQAPGTSLCVFGFCFQAVPPQARRKRSVAPVLNESRR